MKKFLIYFILLSVFSCKKNKIGDRANLPTSENNISSLENSIIIEGKDITKGSWSSNNQFSKEYLQNGIYNTNTIILFNNDGTLEVFENSDSLNSCECRGKYRIDVKNETITILGIENKNCPWLSKVNGKYSLIKETPLSIVNENNIKFVFYPKFF